MEGEGSGDLQMEEEGGSGQAKMESTVDLYRPIEEEKKKPFYAYYNESGSDALVKCKTGDYSRDWFEKILKMGSWLHDSVSYFCLIFLIFAYVFHEVLYTYHVVFI